MWVPDTSPAGPVCADGRTGGRGSIAAAASVPEGCWCGLSSSLRPVQLQLTSVRVRLVLTSGPASLAGCRAYGSAHCLTGEGPVQC